MYTRYAQLYAQVSLYYVVEVYHVHKARTVVAQVSLYCGVEVDHVHKARTVVHSVMDRYIFYFKLIDLLFFPLLFLHSFISIQVLSFITKF